jgi:hypothetical protein
MRGAFFMGGAEMRGWYVLLGLALSCVALATMPGCRNKGDKAKKKKEKEPDLAELAESIKPYSEPYVAQEKFKRGPDLVEHDGRDEIHYYFIRAEEPNRVLRMIYRDNVLIGKSVIRDAELAERRKEAGSKAGAPTMPPPPEEDTRPPLVPK